MRRPSLPTAVAPAPAAVRSCIGPAAGASKEWQENRTAVPPRRGRRERPGLCGGPEANGGWGLRALAETLDRLTGPLIGAQRLLAADLALDWATIAGESLATGSHPDRLVFPPKQRQDGTLHLRVASGAAALELQHESRRLIDRINAHLGFAAVARLKVVQAPLPPARPRTAQLAAADPAPSPPPDDGNAEAVAGEVLAGIEDERLRSALFRLGRRILADARDKVRDAASGEACRGDGEPL